MYTSITYYYDSHLVGAEKTIIIIFNLNFVQRFVFVGRKAKTKTINKPVSIAS